MRAHLLLIIGLLGTTIPVAHAQQLDIQAGPVIEGDGGTALGMDDHQFYRLRAEDASKGQTAYLEGWSLETLTRNFSTHLVMPVQNAEEFRFLGLAIAGAELKVYYSFYNKSDERAVLALASFDNNGQPIGDARELLSMDGRNEKRAGAFVVRIDAEVHIATVLEVKRRNPLGDDPEFFEPEFALHTFSAEGKPIMRKDMTFPGCKGFRIHDLMATKEGGAAMIVRLVDVDTKGVNMDDQSCSPFFKAVLVTNEGGYAEKCLPNLMLGTSRSMASLVRAKDKSVHFVCYGLIKGLATYVMDMDTHGAEPLPASILPFDHDHGFIHFLISADFDDQKRLTCIWMREGFGNKYANKVARRGYFLGTYAADGGLKDTVAHTMDQTYNLWYGNDENFRSNIIHLNEHTYLLTSQLREDVGRIPGAMKRWGGGMSQHNDDLVPAYLCLDDQSTNAPVQQLLPSDPGSFTSFTVEWPCSLPGKDYIIRYHTGDDYHFLRVRPKR